MAADLRQLPRVVNGFENIGVRKSREWEGACVCLWMYVVSKFLPKVTACRRGLLKKGPRVVSCLGPVFMGKWDVVVPLWLGAA